MIFCALVFLMLKKVHELNKVNKWYKCVHEHVEYSKLSILKSFNQGFGGKIQNRGYSLDQGS